MQVFVSYSHEDEGLARTLKTFLAERGLDAWIADDEIAPGDSVASRVRDGMKSASAFVLLIGTQPSSWARNEWSQALQMSWDEKRSLPLIPVLLHHADPPGFLRDQWHVRLDHDRPDWDRIAHVLENSGEAFHWRTSESARTGVADRLNQLEKVAATLPDEPEDEH